jgi:hypothetical protein
MGMVHFPAELGLHFYFDHKNYSLYKGCEIPQNVRF